MFNRRLEIIALGSFGLGVNFVTGQVLGLSTALAGGVLAYSVFVDAFEYKYELLDYLNYRSSKLKNYP